MNDTHPHTPPRAALLLTLAALCASCATATPTPSPSGDCAAGVASLRAALDAADRASEAVSGASDAWTPLARARLARLRTAWQALAAGATPAGLCPDAAPRPLARACAARAEAQARAQAALWADLAASASADPRRALWRAEAKLLAAQDALACDAPASALDGAAARGVNTAGVSARLIPNAAPLRLRATLECQRRDPSGRYTAAMPCDDAPMREDDRFRVRLTTSAPAHVYVMVHNDSGQFQLPFPASAADPNTAEADTDYTLPGPDQWWPLDANAGVLEHIQVVASRDPLPELDALRGVQLDPSTDGQAHPSARRIRGKMEPVVARKGRDLGASAAHRPGISPETLFSEGARVAAAEFTLDHTP